MCSITAIIVLRRFLIMFYDSPNENYEDEDIQTLKETVFDLIRGIRDPEKIETLEELKVVQEDDVKVERFSEYCYLIKIEFIPTVPHCSLASLIGLCLRKKLDRDLPENFKLDVFIKEGTHETAEDINRQINDKERIAAALENQNLRELVDKCVAYEAL